MVDRPGVYSLNLDMNKLIPITEKDQRFVNDCLAFVFRCLVNRQHRRQAQSLPCEEDLPVEWMWVTPVVVTLLQDLSSS